MKVLVLHIKSQVHFALVGPDPGDDVVMQFLSDKFGGDASLIKGYLDSTDKRERNIGLKDWLIEKRGYVLAEHESCRTPRNWQLSVIQEKLDAIKRSDPSS